VAARDLLFRFQKIVRSRATDHLQPWIDEARNSLISSFAVGLAADQSAVAAALAEPWSNGQTEGQITKLKLVKGRCTGAQIPIYSELDYTMICTEIEPEPKLHAETQAASSR